MTATDPDEHWAADPLRVASSFTELLEARAALHPDAVSFTYLDQGEEPACALSYAELDRLARRMAVRLQAHAPPGSRVLLVFPNRPEFAVAFLGCLYAGMVGVPVAPPLHERAAEHAGRVAVQADVALVLAHHEFKGAVRERLMQSLAGRTLQWLALEDLPAGCESEWRRPVIGPGTLALLQYTSGSTGAAKGVMVSHGNLLHNCMLLARMLAFEGPFRVVSWLPFFHDWGLIGSLLFPLSQGTAGWYFDPSAFIAKPLRWLQAIQRFEGHLTCAPNFAYDLCLRRIAPEARTGLDLRSLEVAMVGAEPVRWETLQRFREAFAPHGFGEDVFHPSYGLAEATLSVSGGRRPASSVARPVSRTALKRGEALRVEDGSPEALMLVGCGAPVQDLRIADPVTGVALGDDAVGEIQVAGPSVAGGYWRMPEETRSTFVAGVGQRWLRTGDLGFVSEGQLFLCGRLKDVIIKRGHNLFAADIERVAEGAHPALRPASGAAFALEAAGAERMVVVHELEFGVRADGREVIGAVQRDIVSQFAVRADAIVLIRPGTLQKTSSGKIRRLAMRDAFIAGQLEVVEAWRNW